MPTDKIYAVLPLKFIGWFCRRRPFSSLNPSHRIEAEGSLFFDSYLRPPPCEEGDVLLGLKVQRKLASIHLNYQ